MESLENKGREEMKKKCGQHPLVLTGAVKWLVARWVLGGWQVEPPPCVGGRMGRAEQGRAD